MSKTFSGGCLCGKVSFEVNGPVNKLIMCHCSKCRKITGSISGAILVSKRENLSWRSGKENLAEFTAPSGYYSVFCNTCGSTMPKLRWEKIYLIPAGSIDTEVNITDKLHIHTASKASWHSISDDYLQHEQGIPQRDRKEQ